MEPSDTIEATLRKILVTELFVDGPAEEIDLNESLRNVYGVDSLGFVELRVQCEDLFGVHISDDEFVPENFRTLADVVELVRQLQKG